MGDATSARKTSLQAVNLGGCSITSTKTKQYCLFGPVLLTKLYCGLARRRSGR
jgi:hypothetical protein